MNAMFIYDLSLSIRVGWATHSLSNVGSNGTNRLLGRKVLLADGVEADAASGNILKRGNATLVREYLSSAGEPLCAACARGDGRRAAALVATEQRKEHPITHCGLCDIHGYLITGPSSETENATKGSDDASANTTEGISKHRQNRKRGSRQTEQSESEGQMRQARPSLIEFSFAIALPESQAETRQLLTRVGDGQDGGQMLMTMPNRSGCYALNVRYRAAGVGVDTYTWHVIVRDEARRIARHRTVLSALRDQILSPSGARTASMLPHISTLTGAICIRHTVGRAPLYSGLDPRFIERLQALKIADMTVLPFDGIESFAEIMDSLITDSAPAGILMRKEP